MAINSYSAGMNAYEAGRFEEALNWFLQDEQNAMNAYALGVLYSNGQGVDKSFQKASLYYIQAANGGVAPAMSNAGFAYANALGIPEDFEKATFYLEQAMNQGEVAAKITLAELYAKGYGKGNAKDAARLLREVLATSSNEDAMDVYSRYQLHLA